VSALLDTSLVVAAADASDINHEAAVAWLGRVDEPLLIGALTLVEADHILQRGLGLRATLALLESVASGALRVVAPTDEDLTRAASLLEAAAEHHPRLADAVLVATAERLGVRRVASFERRPLAVLRPAGRVFDLEP
jgi:predicted nucleic acid-binding protein